MQDFLQLLDEQSEDIYEIRAHLEANALPSRECIWLHAESHEIESESTDEMPGDVWRYAFFSYKDGDGDITSFHAVKLCGAGSECVYLPTILEAPAQLHRRFQKEIGILGPAHELKNAENKPVEVGQCSAKSRLFVLLYQRCGHECALTFLFLIPVRQEIYAEWSGSFARRHSLPLGLGNLGVQFAFALWLSAGRRGCCECRSISFRQDTKCDSSCPRSTYTAPVAST